VREIIYTHDAVYRSPYDVFIPNGALRLYGGAGQPTNNLLLGRGYSVKVVTGNGTFDASVAFINFPPYQKPLWKLLFDYLRQLSGGVL